MLIVGPLLHLFSVFVQRGTEMWSRAYFRRGSVRIWTAIHQVICRINYTGQHGL